MTADIEHLGVSLRPCAPWCEDGDGHPHEHPHDRDCIYGLVETVSMAALPPIRMGEGQWWHEWVTAYLRREYDQNEPHIRISNDGNTGELVFTIAEARDLRDLLDTYIETAETAETAESDALADGGGDF